MTSDDNWADWAKTTECPMGRNADGSCFEDPAQDWDSSGSLGVEDTYGGAQRIEDQRKRDNLGLLLTGLGAMAGGGGYGEGVSPPDAATQKLAIPEVPKGTDDVEWVPPSWGRGGYWRPKMTFLGAGANLRRLVR